MVGVFLSHQFISHMCAWFSESPSLTDGTRHVKFHFWSPTVLLTPRNQASDLPPQHSRPFGGFTPQDQTCPHAPSSPPCPVSTNASPALLTAASPSRRPSPPRLPQRGEPGGAKRKWPPPALRRQEAKMAAGLRRGLGQSGAGPGPGRCWGWGERERGWGGPGWGGPNATPPDPKPAALRGQHSEIPVGSQAKLAPGCLSHPLPQLEAPGESLRC